MPDTHKLDPGRAVRLTDLTTRGKDLHGNRQAAEREFASLRDQLVELQGRWYAEGQRKLLVILQAMDAGGKDGTIRRVFRGVNPQGVRVASFKTPTAKELAHDYLWRIHRQVPANGMIGVFNRSHYEDVLIVRVDKIVPQSVWLSRYEQINNFERLLTETGTTILKFFLHISRKEQKKRFKARLNDPAKHWKFSVKDLKKRRQWEAYQDAYEDLLHRCSTAHAPWYVIPADQKWYRDLAVARVLVESLRKLNPQYPEAESHLDQIAIN